MKIPPMQKTQIFNDTMIAFGFEQHVQGPTHRLGKMLDLIFTQLESEVKVTNTTKHGYISDHCMVSIYLHLHKLGYPKIEKTIRDKTRITGEALLISFNAPTIDNNFLDQACHWFSTELLNALDRIAPLKQSSTQINLDSHGSTNTSETKIS